MTSNIRKVSHPGKYVKEAIEALNMSQNEFAIESGMPPNNLDSLINKESSITYEDAERLPSFFHNDIDFWINLQNKYDGYSQSQ